MEEKYKFKSNAFKLDAKALSLVPATRDILEENQLYRGFMNYSNELYNLLKGKEFEFDEITITDNEQFLELFIESLEWRLKIEKELKEDEELEIK